MLSPWSLVLHIKATSKFPKLPILQGYKGLLKGYLIKHNITIVLIDRFSKSLNQNDPHKLAQLLFVDQKIKGQSSRSIFFNEVFVLLNMTLTLDFNFLITNKSCASL